MPKIPGSWRTLAYVRGEREEASRGHELSQAPSIGWRELVEMDLVNFRGGRPGEAPNDFEGDMHGNTSALDDLDRLPSRCDGLSFRATETEQGYGMDRRLSRLLKARLRAQERQGTIPDRPRLLPRVPAEIHGG